MKILLTTHQYFPDHQSGTEVLTRSVARELLHRGHEVRVMTGNPNPLPLADEQRCDSYQHDGVRVYRFHYAHVPMGGQRSRVEVGFDNRLARAYFERIVEEFTPDVIHCFHLNRLGSGLVEVAAAHRIPCFMTPTDFWLLCPTAQLLYPGGTQCTGPTRRAGNCAIHLTAQRLPGWLMPIARCLPAWVGDLLVQALNIPILRAIGNVNEIRALDHRQVTNLRRMRLLSGLFPPNQMMADFLRKYDVAPNQLHLTPFGIDRMATTPVPPPTAHGAPLTFGFVGSLVPHKGCKLLLQAFLRLPHGSARLHIYGNPCDRPDYARELFTLAAGHPHISFCGTFPNEQIDAVLAGFDALVVPSMWSENTPLVIWAAQACRRMVIGSDVEGIRAAITHEVEGLLFPMGDIAALHQQMEQLVQQPELVVEFSERARVPRTTEDYVNDLMRGWGSSVLAKY